MMHIGGEQQRDAEDGEEISDQHALLALRRIDRRDEAEAELLGDDGASQRQRRDRHPRDRAENKADDDFMHQQHQQRRQVLQIDLIGAPMQRHDDGGERQRHAEPDPYRHVHFAKARHQHHHGADAREDEQERRRQSRKKGDIDAHDMARNVPYPPAIRDEILSM